MTVRFSSEHERFGFQALVLENELIWIEVLPGLGGRIWSIVYKPQSREMLWHHPEIMPQRVASGTSFDDSLSGGWDELFPNDAPVTIDGVAYPDHGEIWTAECNWDVLEASSDEVTIALRNIGSATNASIERRLTLHSGEPALRIAYSVRNTNVHPLNFHWKLHPALQMGPNARIEIPAEHVIIDADFAREFLELKGTWPIVKGRNRDQIDFRVAPNPASKSTRFFYFGRS